MAALILHSPPQYNDGYHFDASHGRGDLKVRHRGTSRPVYLTQPGVTYTLVGGPGGMSVGPDGVLSWPVPPDFGAELVQVAVAIQGPGGAKLKHAFPLRVRRGPPPAIGATAIPPSPKPKEPTAAEAPPLRTWTDAKTGRTLRGRMLGLKNGKVRLQRDDGQVFEIPLERFSEPDRQYAGKALPQTPAPEPAAPTAVAVPAEPRSKTAEPKGAR